jgi:hypothetical protein
MRIHNRTDLKYIVIKGRAAFYRCAYACVITQSTAYQDERALYHIETFYGQNAIKTRAAAMRYGSAIVRGRKLPGPYRDQYLPHNFPRDGLPKRENEITIRL